MHTGNTFYSHVRTSSWRRRLPALVAGAALALGVAAPVPTASAAVAVGSIAGVVTDEAGARLEGIVVKVWDLDSYGDVLVSQDTTDAAGAYLAEGIEASPYYRVQFSDPAGDYAFEYYDDTVASAAGGAPFAQWVPVTADATTPDIDAALEPGSAISGRLTDAAGDPVEFGTVSLWWQHATQAYVRAGTFFTDANGNYEIPGVRGQTYALEFSDPATGATEAWNDAPDVVRSTPLVVTSGVGRTGIDAVLGGVVTSTAAPAIAGMPQVGQTLTATSGWSPADTSVTYRWVVGDDTTPGDDPSGATYVPTAQDLGKTIRVRATGTRGAGWTPASAWSVATAPVAAAPVVVPPVVAPEPLAFVNDRAPKITGKLRVGKTLRVTTGAWTPSPEDVEITWYAGRKVIKGAHRQRFTLTAKQVGMRLRVVVTVSSPSYADAAARTARTAKVKARARRG